MKNLLFSAAAAALLAACASTPTPYQAAAGDRDKGYSQQQIETGRYRIAYAGDSVEQARAFALRRAAEATLADGADWFQVVTSYTDASSRRPGGGSSVSIGGSSGSYGSGVGVGLGIGLPLGGGSEEATHVVEIVTGVGERPDDPDAYDARSVAASLGE